MLRAVANALLIGLRGLDMAVRYEAAELMVVLPGADAVEAERVAGRLSHSVARISLGDDGGDELPGVTLSVGACEMAEGDFAEMLIARTDAALQRARRYPGVSVSR